MQAASSKKEDRILSPYTIPDLIDLAFKQAEVMSYISDAVDALPTNSDEQKKIKKEAKESLKILRKAVKGKEESRATYVPSNRGETSFERQFAASEKAREEIKKELSKKEGDIFSTNPKVTELAGNFMRRLDKSGVNIYTPKFVKSLNLYNQYRDESLTDKEIFNNKNEIANAYQNLASIYKEISQKQDFAKGSQGSDYNKIHEFAQKLRDAKTIEEIGKLGKEKMTFDGIEVSEMTQGFLILVCMIVLVRMYVFL
jgi:hypothetical protein